MQVILALLRSSLKFFTETGDASQQPLRVDDKGCSYRDYWSRRDNKKWRNTMTEALGCWGGSEGSMTHDECVRHSYFLSLLGSLVTPGTMLLGRKIFKKEEKVVWTMTQGVRQVAQKLGCVSKHNKVDWDSFWLFLAHYLTPGGPAASNVLLWQKAPIIVNVSAPSSLLFPVCPSVCVSCWSVFIVFPLKRPFRVFSNARILKHSFFAIYGRHSKVSCYWLAGPFLWSSKLLVNFAKHI